jgi:hypothetical protein
MPRELGALVPLRFLRAIRAVPVARENVGGRATLVVAMSDPDDLRAIDELAFATGMRIRAVRADEAEILRALEPAAEPACEPEDAWLAPSAIELGPTEKQPMSESWLVPLADET